ncbi:uncharacterized protein PHACADRAFT_258959 [Phanerochaete carnosa HHB-10118-sp]|uniref:F-box domain-containing protein n=1 Tax=Phanerochaete carnosa (strain HHB-10118-sp) TaxID=650164 RepID=K5VTM2_PHACS|nr:uncharacterized protein PHACADRAFT_258959 [Phanerochaete carnosa HHB-10118-sp]EKM54828.1 hypothetical protein PHACADRAFT_258959 [Phanerochaete carnosa HHB-10118-sp]
MVRTVSTGRIAIETEATWQAISQLPDVREIEIADSQGTAASLFRFMEQSPLAFPKLERLVFRNIIWNKEPKQAGSLMLLLIRLLEGRKERGLGVRRLDVHSGSNVDTKSNFHQDLPKLKMLVEELEFSEGVSQDGCDTCEHAHSDPERPLSDSASESKSGSDGDGQAE